MANYRVLWLENALGQTYALTDESRTFTFLNTPTGFGFTRSYSVEKVGNLEILTSEEFSTGNVTGELVFYNPQGNDYIYQDYQDFIDFIKYKHLRLYYQTPNLLASDSFYTNILITSIQKGEIDEVGMLKASITFHKFTPWFNATDTVIKLDNTLTSDGKHYNLVRPYHYSSTGFDGATIINQGTNEVGFIFTISGDTITNPYFALSQNGEVYGVCRINGTYDYVMINSIEDAEQIYLELNGTVIASPEQKQDFTVRDGAAYLTWCKLKTGTSTIRVSGGNIDTFAGEVTVAFKNSYVSV